MGEIPGHAVERFPGLATRAIGQKNVPGVAQSLILEEAVVLTAETVIEAAREVLGIQVGSGGGGGGIVFVPPRYFVS